jgi:hypothetical protein
MNVDDGPERNRNRRDTSGENIKGQPRWLKRNKGGYNLIHGWTTAGANTHEEEEWNRQQILLLLLITVDREKRDPQITHHHSSFCVWVRRDTHSAPSPCVCAVCQLGKYIKETRRHQSLSLFSFVLLLLWWWWS